MGTGWPWGPRMRCIRELGRDAVSQRLDAAGAGPGTGSNRASKRGIGRAGRDPVLDAASKLNRLGKRRNRRKSFFVDPRPRLHRLLLAEPNLGAPSDLLTYLPHDVNSSAPARNAQTEARACRPRRPSDSPARLPPARNSLPRTSCGTRSCTRGQARPSAGAARRADEPSPAAAGRRIIACATRLPDSTGLSR